MIREPEKLEPYPVPVHPHPGQIPFPEDDPVIVFPAAPGRPDWEQAVYRAAPEGDQVVGIGDFEQQQLDNPNDTDLGYDQVVGIGEFEQQQLDNPNDTDVEIGQ